MGQHDYGENGERGEQPPGGYPLAEPQPVPADDDEAWIPGVTDRPPKDRPPPERFQFFLAEMLVLTAAAVLFMGVVSLVAGGQSVERFAGVAGLGILVGMVVLILLPSVRPIIQVGWWVMLGLYLLACAAAVLQG